MNLNKNQHLLSTIDDKLNAIETDIDLIKTNTNTMVVDLDGIDSNTADLDGIRIYSQEISDQTADADTKLGTINTSLNNIETDIDTINTNISLLKNDVQDIGVTLSTFNERNKTFVYEPLNWPPNGWNFLNAGNYVGNQQVGTYQNTDDTNLYVTKYVFGYLYPSTSMNQAQLYHSNSFTSKIGLYNGSSFEDVNISLNANRLQYDKYVQIGVTNTSNNRLHLWSYDFSDAPICIPPQNYLGHSIAGDFSSYDNWSTCGSFTGYRL